MKQHIIKLIWKRKAKTIMLTLEITLAFFVLFIIGCLAVYNYKNYIQAMGFDHQNVWVLKVAWNDEPGSSILEKANMIRQNMRSKKEIESVCLVSNYPFSYMTSTTTVDESKSNKEAHFFSCNEGFFEILKAPVLKGRSFSREDQHAAKTPVVLNQLLAEQLFPDEDPIGKEFDKFKVVGLIGNFRYQDAFMENDAAIFQYKNVPDTSGLEVEMDLMFRVKPGTGRTFEAQLISEVNAITQSRPARIVWLEEAKEAKDKLVWVPVLLLAIVCGFLVINVALGLLGLLWYNINKRHAEIGLRKAMGADNRSIARQIITEVMVVTSFGLLIGLFFAIQFPLMGVFGVDPMVYILAIVFSMGLIFGINLLCSYFPSRLASRIQPAMALHEE